MRISIINALTTIKPANSGHGQIWCVNNIRHRENGPAEIYKFNDYLIYKWKINGEMHRLDGPALLRFPESTTCKVGLFWFKNGQCHREDGPSDRWESGEKRWYKNDKLHRIGGPAIIDEYGNQF